MNATYTRAYSIGLTKHRNMSVSNESPSSSDDDDMLKALREATDVRFLKDSLFHHKDETENDLAKDEKTALPKSLRRSIEFVEQSNEFGVTQDFKNFVAKHLEKSLDKCVREIHHKNDSESSREKKIEDASIGIKLLTNSVVNLNDIENNEKQNIEHNKRHRKKFKSQNNSADSISKCQQVAVEPDWILSKVSTAVWTDRLKGAVFRYKKSDDGALREID